MLDHYFIIKYNQDTDSWVFDTDEMLEVYPDGSVWDRVNQNYVSFKSMEPKDKDAARALSGRVRKMLAYENKETE